MALPVLLVHGIRVSRTMWDPVVGRLDRPAFAVDLPGHGSRRGETFAMAAATEAVADAVDHVGGRALLAGLSLGGFVGIAAAGRYPARVAGLVAIGCTARSTHLARLYRAAAALAARFPAQANQFSAYAFRRALPPPAADAVLAGGLTSEVLPAVVTAVAGHDQLGALAGYPGPVWLVNGDRDPFRADERAYLAACRDGRLVRLPRTGHVTALADPVRLARLIEDAAAHAERQDRTRSAI